MHFFISKFILKKALNQELKKVAGFHQKDFVILISRLLRICLRLLYIWSDSSPSKTATRRFLKFFQITAYYWPKALRSLNP